MKGLESIERFRSYASAEEYKAATGRTASWNPLLQPKRWEDPDALDAQEDMIVYKIIKGVTELGPTFKSLFLYPRIAATVNIPPSGPTVPGSEQPEVPHPVRELLKDERIILHLGMPVVLAPGEAVPGPANKAEFTWLEKEQLLRAAAKILSSDKL